MPELPALAVAVLLLALTFSSLTFPSVEGDTVPLGAGEELSLDLEIASTTHVDYVVRSNGAPIGVVLMSGGAVVAEEIDVGQVRRSLRLEPGHYRFTIAANESAGTELEYRINLDPEVLSGLTAKNVLVLSIAAALGVAAVFMKLIRKR